jgi:uncharacterized protein involved in response to NO
MAHLSRAAQAIKSTALYPRFPLLGLGFRPFYLLAGAFAVLAVPVWIAQYAGWLGSGSYLSGSLWHAHEMIFGYALAVIAGFLLTAVRVWTNRATPTGATLGAMAALWLAGRLLVLTPYAIPAMWVDAAFPLAVAVAIALPLKASGNRRNYFFVLLLAAMSAANFAFHFAVHGVAEIAAKRGLQIGLDLILFIMAVIGGRVIPMFTNNAIPGAQARRSPLLEKLSLISLIALLAGDLVALSGPSLAAVALLAAVAHGLRLIMWRSWLTSSRPIVWILHVAYAWIVVHLLLRTLAVVDVVPAQLAIHALTIGAIGGLTLGMMTRTARGHTGYPLQADRADVICYILIQFSAITRVFVPLVVPQIYFSSIVASGVLWSLAFTVFTVRYWPILSRPRLDGGAG